MVGILCGAMVYALCNYLFGLREWAVDDEDLPLEHDAELLEVVR